MDIESMPRAKKHYYVQARNFINNYPELTTLVVKLYQGDTHSINDISQMIVKKYKVMMRPDFITPMMDLKGIARRTHKQVNSTMSKKLKGHGWNV